MDDHSKLEGLEIFYSASEKRFFILCFLLNPSPIPQILAILTKNDNVTCHMTYGKVYYTSKC